ncbi:hypothetical protein LSCM1_00494 [Leishmania martiniquensis]|uniref:Inosine triphosphate pyrophosphatase n=1 Tax=Leishmania martiniquensis TaxID=1580590 RepID=A0A836GC03_9TRYP|nr:hypothetical protein LSCM1_00494 [Leishmania martiniquensis]
MSCPPLQKISLVSGNKGKLAEVQRFLAHVHVIVEAVKVDIPEPQNSSVEKISWEKAVEAYRLVNSIPTGAPLRDGGAPVLVDDTSLELDALGGLPGPYIKWFVERVGAEGLLKMVKGFAAPGEEDSTAAAPAHRRANAVCVLSFCHGVDEATGQPMVEQFRGVCRGALAAAPRGGQGFGWDSIFAIEAQEPAYSKTFAEMSDNEKNVLSHRAMALEKLVQYLETHGAVPRKDKSSAG